MKLSKKAIEHLNSHQEYPATKAELIEACNNLSDFSSEEKKWFSKSLPSGSYESAEDVIAALS